MWEYGKEQMLRSGLLFMDNYEDGSSNLLQKFVSNIPNSYQRHQFRWERLESRLLYRVAASDHLSLQITEVKSTDLYAATIRCNIGEYWPLISGAHRDSAYLFAIHASQVLLVAPNDKDEV
jgi:hypothetical protein